MAERLRGRLYGRRQGKSLRAGQQAVIETRLPQLLAVEQGPIAPPWSTTWLEIGFGAGEHLLCQMSANPETGFIAAEPFVNGMAALLMRLEEADEKRIMLWDQDARDLIVRLKSNSIDRAFLLFPDPWPKKRHWKRRFVSQETLSALHAVLIPGARLRMATDWPDYACWMLIEIARHGGFEWTACKASDWREPPTDHFPTRYEAKARAQGRRPVYLDFERL